MVKLQVEHAMKFSIFLCLGIFLGIGSPVFAKELAVCTTENHPPSLFDAIHCQDSTRALTQNGQSNFYQTTLYQLTYQGWHITDIERSFVQQGTSKKEVVFIYLKRDI